MTSVQERLKLKRVPHDQWSTREQLCLASSVSRSGDQNWISVSRSLKPFAEKEALRPPDWFSQKSCAAQYAQLLENADTPKRKKRESGETTGESIVRRFTQLRISELRQILAFQRDEYQQLKAEVNLLRSGPLSDEKLQKMWHVIELEEREQEQKARAHAAWLAKRQQKQDSQPSQSVSPGVQKKPSETASENHETTDSFSNDEDDKKNRDGRSPLLTSLLKSPSPTTQIQNQTAPAQVGSPTIASLLGSSPKVPNPQLTQTVSPQLQQLVSTAIANATPERPSAGAPTLSMLLELPSNTQRGPLPNLQNNASADVHIQSRSTGQAVPANVVQMVHVAPRPPTPNIPVTESMVQIIDHIDDFRRKDIMSDVIDKDEINEIIGDIEELIKEEITGSPRTNEGPAVIPVVTPVCTTVVSSVTSPIVNSVVTANIEGLAIPQKQEIIQERQEPRDVDEPISLSDSADSEMAIEEIDSSTSNIAEIIGTIAVELPEPKAVVCETPPNVIQEQDEEIKTESIARSESTAMSDKSVYETEDKDIPESEDIPMDEQEVFVEEKEKEVQKTTVEESNDSEDHSAKEHTNDKSEEENTEEKSEIVEPEKDNSCDTTIDQKEKSEDAENEETAELDQLEIHLAEITGDAQDTPSAAEQGSVSSETTNDIPSVEDTERSQDISLILEDDSSQSSQSKNKAITRENVIEPTGSLESNNDEPIATLKDEITDSPREETIASQKEATNAIPKEEITEIQKGDCTTMVKDESTMEIESTVEVKDLEEIKKEETKDSFENAKSPVSPKDDAKNKEVDKETVIADSNVSATTGPTEDLKKDPEIEESIKSEEKDSTTKKTDMVVEVKQEIKDIVESEPIVKKEVADPVVSDLGEMDEEESGLSKLSGGRAMKTYSKRQPPSVDSEPENETGGEGADYRAWKKAVMLVFNRLATHKYASVFLRPITEDQAPGYHSVIFRPMDLSTIKKNIDNGTIRSTMHFQRDVMLMFQNAIMYNKQDTFVYKMAVSMQEECLQHMQILVQVTGEGPFRRETRTAASTSGEINDAGAKRKRSHITPSPHDSESPRTNKKRRKSEND